MALDLRPGKPDSENLSREIVRLKDVVGLTWPEIEEEIGLSLGISLEGCRSRYRRYKRKVKTAPGGDFDVPPGVQARVSRNEVILTAKAPHIQTLDDLLEFCQVDLDVWYVDRHKLNAWPLGIKEEFRDLAIEDGRISGTIKTTGEVAFGQMVQVTAWLFRREPEALFPTIRPMRAASTFKAPPEATGPAIRSLIWTDPHFGYLKNIQDAALDPFHCRYALDLIVQIAEVICPDRVDILGDFFDFPEWTDRFKKRPEFYWTTQPAIVEGHWWLAQLRRALPDTAINLHEGNHDARMRDAVEKHLPAAYDLRSADKLESQFGLLSVPNLLDLDGLGIRWIGDYPDDLDWIDELRLEHGGFYRKGQDKTAKAMAEETGDPVAFGHVHKDEIWRRAFSVGCTCRLDGKVPAKSARNYWVKGFGVVDVVRGSVSTTFITVDKRQAVWDRRAFEARDRVEDLRNDHPQWNW